MFGSVGGFDAGNTPWSMVFGSEWTDNNGNLWLFGGLGENEAGQGHFLNDMLEFQPSLNLVITGGSQAVSTITVAPQNGFNSNVTFSCTGLPSGGTCTFSPASLATAQGLTSALTISVPSQSANTQAHRTSRITAACFLVWLFGWIKRRLQRTILLGLILGGLELVYGCGSAQNVTSSCSIPVTSIVTITGTSSGIQQTTALSVTVK